MYFFMLHLPQSISYSHKFNLNSYGNRFICKADGTREIENLKSILKNPDELWPTVKMKMKMNRLKNQIPSEPNMRFCYTMLQKISKTYPLIIQQMDPDKRDLICIFYLILRALDTIEDDPNLPPGVKVPILTAFHNHMYDPNWHFSCGTEDSKVLMDNFHHVSTAFLQLDSGYQRAMEDITMKMGKGMAKFTGKEIETIEDYDEYCHYANGVPLMWILQFSNASRQEHSLDKVTLDKVSSSAGLFSQKTHIIKSYLEDINETPKLPMFWPRQIWIKYVNKLEDLQYEENSIKAVQCLNEMVTNALGEAEDTLMYFAAFSNPTMMRAWAIPYILSVGTLALCYNNIHFFRRHVKLRPGLVAKAFDRTNTMGDVYAAFHECSLIIKSKIDDHDPNAKHTTEMIESILKTCKDSGKLKGRIGFYPLD